LKKLKIFGILSLILFVSIGCLEEQKRKIAYLSLQAEKLQKEYVPLKFKINERSNEVIRFEVKLFDADANEIAYQKYELHGKELAFDFYVMPIKDGFLSFPYQIFTDEIAPENGIPLLNLYDKNGFPELFRQKNMQQAAEIELKSVFLQMKANIAGTDSTAFGNAVHDVFGLKQFEINTVYKIVARTKGGIEIVTN